MSVILASVLILPTILLSLLIVGTAGALLGSWAVLVLGGAWLLYGVVLVWIAWYAPERARIAAVLDGYRRPEPAEARLLALAWEPVARAADVPGRHPLRVQDGARATATPAPSSAIAVTAWALHDLSAAQVSALLAQALGHHAGADPRLRLCGAWCAWPAAMLWRVLALVGRPFDLLGYRAPVVRAVLGLVSLPVLVVVLGHRVGLPAAILLAAVLAVEPFTRAARSRAAETAADRYAVALGYGPPLAAALRTWAAAHEPPLPLWYRRLLGSEAPTPVRLREIERAAPERPVPGGRAA
ncbi:M48 family metalloprotease [Nocardia farcinica]|uniref:M48 family metalloprotease n=1 Tax=Nocardia farcinica TaxID=37329 RepID=UPI001895DD1C|nr:M48 family metalloprotease [Nocardia farcinica]MBF6263066.1 M48 family metalloprotease [Nocardia farcinica]MBF6281570.1 M48 family metalloprotease [Nocardia farcinica]MBF6305634.1 M48 family metalloprotease [Nocardia farcinica]MBF6386654.1 M48 family metalloprotease [Nocardia farcinica]MBF6390137.1 M48 family metalloprotease [Nocardia farcinica]